MKFDLSEDQALLRQSTRELLNALEHARQVDPEFALRAGRNRDIPPERWELIK